MMNKFVVITSIHSPTETVKLLSHWQGWKIVVIGDKKTPTDWQYDNVDYLSVARQSELFGDFASALPFNRYSRKNLGYIYAIKNNADVIFETDDDNLPLPSAKEKLEELINTAYAGSNIVEKLVTSQARWVNIYSLFTDEGTRCWPRGYPLDLINVTPECHIKHQATQSPVWQFLVDKDPDVDAIYRLTSNKSVTFKQGLKYAVDFGLYSPFNSQCTLWFPEAFSLMYLTSFTTMRVTDILRSYLAQRALRAEGKRVAFLSPICYQERNYHDLITDFVEEYDLYVNAHKYIDILDSVTAQGMKETYCKGIESLAEQNLLKPDEYGLYMRYLEEAGLV